MNYISANQAAFACSTTFSVSTILLCFKAVETATKTNTFFYGFLALLSGAASLSAITSWASSETTDSKVYFQKFKSHLAVGIPAIMEAASKTVLNAVGKGVTQGIEELTRRKIVNWGNSDRP